MLSRCFVSAVRATRPVASASACRVMASPLVRGYASAPHEGQLRFNTAHDWVVVDADGIAAIGITDFAQDQLGDIVWVDAPDVGDEIDLDDEFAVVESVKAASDLIAPVSGEVTEINEALGDAPGLMNTAPESDGWVIKVKISDIAEFDQLMDRDEYTAYCNDSE